jgi:hypothetical protein
MRLIISALALAAVWSGLTLDRRRKLKLGDVGPDVDRWEGEGGGVDPGGPESADDVTPGTRPA